MSKLQSTDAIVKAALRDLEIPGQYPGDVAKAALEYARSCGWSPPEPDDDPAEVALDTLEVHAVETPRAEDWRDTLADLALEYARAAGLVDPPGDDAPVPTDAQFEYNGGYYNARDVAAESERRGERIEKLEAGLRSLRDGHRAGCRPDQRDMYLAIVALLGDA